MVAALRVPRFQSAALPHGGAAMNKQIDLFITPSDPVDSPADLAPVLSDLRCQNCGALFTARMTGGKAQRFCRRECRAAFHNKRNVDERGPTCTLQTETAVVEGPSAEKARQKGPEVESHDDFRWYDNDSVVLPQQSAMAVYQNLDGDLVIRQQQWPDEDVRIVIKRGNEQRFLDALCDALGVM